MGIRHTSNGQPQMPQAQLLRMQATNARLAAKLEMSRVESVRESPTSQSIKRTRRHTNAPEEAVQNSMSSEILEERHCDLVPQTHKKTDPLKQVISFWQGNIQKRKENISFAWEFEEIRSCEKDPATSQKQETRQKFGRLRGLQSTR